MNTTHEPRRRTGIIALCASILALATAISLALYSVTDKGAWSENWPKELEPLRSQARTLVHSQFAVHEIPFSEGAQFERAWPHILSVKSKEAPLTFWSSPYTRLGNIKAGVRILSPLTGTLVGPEGARYPAGAETVIPEGKSLRIGPPWPEHIKSASGALPEYVVNENGQWTPYRGQAGKAHDLRRARIEIELIVDGEIVDLNRIPLPAETPIIDKRFKDRTPD